MFYDDVENARKFDTPLNIIEAIEERIKFGDLEGLKKLMTDKDAHVHESNVMSMNLSHPKIRDVCIWLIQNNRLGLPKLHCYTCRLGQLFVEYASEDVLIEDINSKIECRANFMYTNLEILRNVAIRRNMNDLLTNVTKIQDGEAEKYLKTVSDDLNFENKMLELICKGDLEGIKELSLKFCSLHLTYTSLSIKDNPCIKLSYTIQNRIAHGLLIHCPNAKAIYKWALQETDMYLSTRSNLDAETLSYISEYKLTNYVFDKYLRPYVNVPKYVLKTIFQRKMYELVEFIFRFVRYYTPNCRELLHDKMSDDLIKTVINIDDMKLIKLCIRYIKNFDMSYLTPAQIERYSC